MIIKFFKKYLSIIFVIATLMGVFHHHEDLKQHNDCQICTIQTNIANADTPEDAVYLQQISTLSESIIADLSTLNIASIKLTRNARAPPKIS